MCLKSMCQSSKFQINLNKAHWGLIFHLILTHISYLDWKLSFMSRVYAEVGFRGKHQTVWFGLVFHCYIKTEPKPKYKLNQTETKVEPNRNVWFVSLQWSRAEGSLGSRHCSTSFVFQPFLHRCGHAILFFLLWILLLFFLLLWVKLLLRISWREKKLKQYS